MKDDNKKSEVVERNDSLPAKPAEEQPHAGLYLSLAIGLLAVATAAAADVRTIVGLVEQYVIVHLPELSASIGSFGRLHLVLPDLRLLTELGVFMCLNYAVSLTHAALLLAGGRVAPPQSHPQSEQPERLTPPPPSKALEAPRSPSKPLEAPPPSKALEAPRSPSKPREAPPPSKLLGAASVVLGALALPVPFLLESQYGLPRMGQALTMWVTYWKVLDIVGGTCRPAVLQTPRSLLVHLLLLVEYRGDATTNEAASPGELTGRILHLARLFVAFVGLGSAYVHAPPAFLAASTAGAALLQAVSMYAAVWVIFFCLAVRMA